MKMPATTIVAAWMSADTGVGPAMASGSQVCRMNWPDFDITAAVRQHDGDQQQQVVDAAAVGQRVDLEDVEAVRRPEQRDHADEQADVADAVGDERLERGVGVRLLLPPVADEHERAEADQLPAGDELHRVEAHHEHEHRRGEQRQEREVVRVAPVAADVVGAVDVHQQRDDRDDEEHHHAETVDERADRELHAARLEPGPLGDDGLYRWMRLFDLGRRRCLAGAVRLRGGRPAPSACDRRLASFTRVIHAPARQQREDEAEPDGGDADLRALLRHALAEEQDQRRTTPP